MWESKPERFADLLHLVVFLPKRDGGYRPIGLMISLFRVWSRLRRPLSELWEREHDEDFYWGAPGKSCDHAGWAHLLLEEAAVSSGQHSGSFFADLHKFYEFVSHEVLLSEAQEVGYPLRLLRALMS